MKTTLFKAQAVSVCTYNGYVVPKPTILASLSINKEVIWFLKPPPQFVEGISSPPSAGLWFYYDQEIDIIDGKATVKGKDSHSGQEIESVFEFIVKSSRNIQESDLMEFTDPNKSVSIEQLQSDSDNYRFLINRAETYGSFSFNQVGGCIEVWDGSTAKELDADITQMRKEHETKKT